MADRKIVAVIPARAGSRRLKNKNILPFNISPFSGMNLLTNKIHQLKKVVGLGGIVVSSNSDEMLDMARDCGVGVHKREEKYSDDISVPFGDVVKNVCEHVDATDIMWAPCTCPLTMPYHYSRAILDYNRNVPALHDSLVAFESLKIFLWDDNGPLNYGIGSRHVLSQDLPSLYRPTNGIFIAPRDKMIEWRYFHGANPFRMLIDKRHAVDIDDCLDMKCALAWKDDAYDIKPRIKPFGNYRDVYVFSNVYHFNDDRKFVEKLECQNFPEGSLFLFLNKSIPFFHAPGFFTSHGDVMFALRENLGSDSVLPFLENERQSHGLMYLYDDGTICDREFSVVMKLLFPEYPSDKIPTTGYMARKICEIMFCDAKIHTVNFYGNADFSTPRWYGHAYDFEDGSLRSMSNRIFISP